MATLFITALIVPVCIGRLILDGLGVPEGLHHDPVCAMIGAFVLATSSPWLKQLSLARVNDVWQAARSVPVYTYIVGKMSIHSQLSDAHHILTNDLT